MEEGDLGVKSKLIRGRTNVVRIELEVLGASDAWCHVCQERTPCAILEDLNNVDRIRLLRCGLCGAVFE